MDKHTESEEKQNAPKSDAPEVRPLQDGGPLRDGDLSQDGSSEQKDDKGRGRKKRDLIEGFFSSRALLLAALAMLLSVIVMLVFAVFFGGHVFDKTAFIFGVLFVVQFAYWLKINRKRRHLVLTVIYGAVALAFVALYALEATGVLP